MAHKITCTSIGIFEGALTRGKQYELLTLDEQKQQVKIQGDNGRTRWFPAGNFDLSGGAVPILVEWRFDDMVHDKLNGWDETKNYVDVTVRLDDGQARWLSFVTPDYLKWLLEEKSDPARWGGENEPAVWGEHIVVIRDLATETVGWMLRHLDQQGELIAHTRPVGGEDELENEPQSVG